MLSGLGAWPSVGVIRRTEGPSGYEPEYAPDGDVEDEY